MEGEAAKQAEIVTPKPLEFEVGNFKVKICTQGRKMSIGAYSEISGKMFEGIVEDKDLNEGEKAVLVDYEGVYFMIEDCLLEKRPINLSDVGELTFPYLQGNKRQPVERRFLIKLKEVQLDETKKLFMKVDRLEEEFTKKNKILQEEIVMLKTVNEQQTKRFEEEHAKQKTLQQQQSKLFEELLAQLRTFFQEELAKQKTLQEQQAKRFQEELLKQKNTLQEEHSKFKTAMQRQLKQLEEAKLNKPPEFKKVVPELDSATTSIAKATVNGTQVSTNKGIAEYHPFFLTHRLQDRESFEVEVVAVGSYSICIGVAADTLRNVGSCYSNADSLTLYFNDGNTYLYSETKQTDISAVTAFTPKDGHRILVKVDRTAQEVEWSTSRPSVHKLYTAVIPACLQNKTLLPVVHLICNHNNVVKFV